MTTIRVATEADAEEILAIYAKYIEQTAITFEYVVPSIEEFRGRIRHTLERFPYLAAEKDGKIAGYAYVSPFKERAAYAWACSYLFNSTLHGSLAIKNGPDRWGRWWGHKAAQGRRAYSTSLAKSARRERSPRARVMWPPWGQPLNLSTA